jgi:hypothetical protein
MRKTLADAMAVAFLLIGVVFAWGGPVLNALADALGAP